MTDNDFKNLEDIQRILKYLDKGKLDVDSWPNALKLKESLDKGTEMSSKIIQQIGARL